MMSKLWLKHQKFMKGNAGFSLVELIIVIAIMAALIAILAPQYLKYVEKSRVSADDTTADEIFNAVQVAASDPAVILAIGTYSVTWHHNSGGYTIAPTTGAFAEAIVDALGATSATNPSPVKATTHATNYVASIVVAADGSDSDTDLDLTISGSWTGTAD